MKQFIAVFEHIANYLPNEDLGKLLRMDEFKSFYSLFNKYIIKNNITIIQNNHTLRLLSKNHKQCFIKHNDITYYPEIFTLSLYKTMCDINPFCNLQKLYLMKVKLNNRNFITSIGSIKHLQKLKINDCNLNLRLILKNKFNSLTHLEIVKTIINFNKFISYFYPNNFQVLQTIALINVNINTQNDITCLSRKLNQITSITSIDLSGNNSAFGLNSEFFLTYNNFNNLNSLQLSHCNLSHLIIYYLYDKMKNNKLSNLKKLYLNGNNIFGNDKGNLRFIELLTCLQLEELDISDTNITETMILICSTILLPRIQYLSIYNCHIKEYYKKKLDSNFDLVINNECNKCTEFCYHMFLDN